MTERREAVDYLKAPLDRHLASLFDEMSAATTTCFQTSAFDGPVWMGDLSRFGTLDFISGQVLGGAKGSGPALNRGFLPFSFFPKGPQTRTPGDVSEASLESGRYALSLGYSVTGASKGLVSCPITRCPNPGAGTIVVDIVARWRHSAGVARGQGPDLTKISC